MVEVILVVCLLISITILVVQIIFKRDLQESYNFLERNSELHISKLKFEIQKNRFRAGDEVFVSQLFTNPENKLRSNLNFGDRVYLIEAYNGGNYFYVCPDIKFKDFYQYKSIEWSLWVGHMDNLPPKNCPNCGKKLLTNNN